MIFAFRVVITVIRYSNSDKIVKIEFQSLFILRLLQAIELIDGIHFLTKYSILMNLTLLRFNIVSCFQSTKIAWDLIKTIFLSKTKSLICGLAL